MIMTGLQEWNMRTLKEKIRTTVKKISKMMTIQKAKIIKIKMKMKI